MEQATITLGGTDYPIATMTLGQMKKIGMASTKWRSARPGASPEEVEQAWYDGTFAMIAVATGLSLEQVTELTGVNFTQLVDATGKILELAGLKQNEADTGGAGRPKGEATGG